MFTFNPFTGNFDAIELPDTVGAALVGVIDGVNRVFTTPDKFQAGTVRVFFNGVRLTEPDDYAASESGGPGSGYDTITFVVGLAPRAGDHLLADYRKV